MTEHDWLFAVDPRDARPNRKIDPSLNSEDIRRMYYEDRLNICQIARRFGVSRQRISQIIGKVGGSRIGKSPYRHLAYKSGTGRYIKSVAFNVAVAKRRFWKHIIHKFDTGCWIWDGPKQGSHGYGRFIVVDDVARFFGRQRQISPRTFAWYIVHGKFMENPYVTSTCGNTLCCNPAHFPHGGGDGR